MSRYSHHQPPEDQWPSRSDLALEHPCVERPDNRADLITRLVELQDDAA